MWRAVWTEYFIALESILLLQNVILKTHVMLLADQKDQQRHDNWQD